MDAVGRRAQKRQAERRRARGTERRRRYFSKIFPTPDPEANHETLGKQVDRIALGGRQRRELRQIIRASTSEQRMVLRSRIVLYAGRGWSKYRIAEELDIHVHTVRKWCRRYAALGILGLMDAPRDGRSRKFSGRQRHLVIAKVLSAPPPPLARWTLSDLRDRLVEEGTVPSISRETIGSWLRKAELKPHRNRYWLNSKDPEFTTKMLRVVDLYLNPPKDGTVLCLDEMTGVQARERKAPDLPMMAGACRRMEFEYIRHGTVRLIAAFEVLTGQVIAECGTHRNNSVNYIRFVRILMEAYPEEKFGKLYLVMDNHSSHKSKLTRGFLDGHSRLVPVYLPVHASWLNQVEIWFSILSRRALKHVSFKSQAALKKTILSYVDYHNRCRKRPFRWTYTGQPLAA